MSLIETRHHQMFPVFDRAQIETAKRFASGPARNFAPGEVVFEAGERNAPALLVLKGSIDVVRRDGLNRESPITSHGPGQFSGEVSQLAGAGVLASGRAGPQGCTALPFDAAHVRALMVGSADVGEILMRAFILRRVGLIEEGGVGSVLIGKPGTPELVRLEGFLGRNGYPYTVLDASDDADGRAVVERFGVLPDELPLMVCPNGTVLKRPTDASARIENYLGFPTGISGMALAGRAFNQALKFGAEIAIPLEVARLDCGSNGHSRAPLQLELTNGNAVRARTVVVASGARYRRPPISNLSVFEGAGVSYWASPVEAKLCGGEEVALVGGGNSAG